MTMPLRLFLDHLDTPIGRFAIVADEQGRPCAAGFTEGHARMERQLRLYSTQPAFSLSSASDPGGLTSAMGAYFAGDLTAIDALPVTITGSDFERGVWKALREIPCGETWSYSALARHVRNPAAARAVGLANGRNPVCIIVPCHRVIGANGTLTGYGGGVERKRWLLAHESQGTPDRERFSTNADGGGKVSGNLGMSSGIVSL
jgi:methylated-DNA-[protein]-cysteine S-methyltransferase